mgnify:CR=1 FL=1
MTEKAATAPISALRRPMMADKALVFPEGTACADVLIAGEKGGSLAKMVFKGLGIATLYKVSMEILGLWKATPIYSAAKDSAFPRATVNCDITPEYLGVGYIIGFELSAINFSGGVLAWLVFIPLAFFLDPNLAANLSAGGVAPAEGELIFSVWYNIVRPVAVGAMLVGAANTMWGMRASISQAFAGAFKRSHAGTEKSRLDRDLDSRGILLGIVGLTIPMTWIYWNFTHNLVGAIVAAVVMLVLGFLLSAVGGYLVGLVGGSNQPVSGLTLSALILAALLMVAFGVTGLQGVGAVLGVSAVVCCAICVSGSLIQDLKVGHLLGGTPKKMEIAEIIATITTAFVLVFPMLWLHQANIKQGGIGIGDRELSAPQAGLCLLYTSPSPRD